MGKTNNTPLNSSSTVLETKITETKVYQVRAIRGRKGSDYKYRLFVDGQGRTLYKSLAEAEKHIEALTYMSNLRIESLTKLQTEKET